MVLICSNIHGQQNATTEDGQKIIIYNNGTWKYKKQNVELNFYSKKNNKGQTRLFININGRSYDIYHWFTYNDENYIDHGVKSMDIINKNSSQNQKELYKGELEKYGTYANYEKRGGVSVSFYPVVEKGVIKVYKEAFIFMPEQHTKEILTTIKI